MRQCAETPVHIAIVEYLRAVLPGALVIHIPNGGKRGKREAAELKRMGVVAGVPDLVILLNGGAVLFLEVKSKKGKLSPDQEAFAQFCDGDFPFRVVRSVDDAREFLVDLGIKTREAA